MGEFEGWCPGCRVSAPIERRRCVHCGAPLERGRMPQTGMRGTEAPAEAPMDPEEAARAALSGSPITARRAVAIAWVLTAMLGVLLRNCLGE